MAGLLSRLLGRPHEPEPDQPTAQIPVSPHTGADGTQDVSIQVTEVAPAAGEPGGGAPADVDPAAPPPAGPGFLGRGRLRRRLRYVRRARELALRDLGGLVFDLHRFRRDRTDLVDQKLAALSALDGELRTLESALGDRRQVTVLREPGLASCPRCGALHASDANFCSMCGLPVGRSAGLPAGPVAAPGAEEDGPLTVVPGPGPGEHRSP